jgi:2-iminobutanoate/2-iminopropanoate deaminase
MKKALWTGAKVAEAPYTPGVQVGAMVFVSGQVPLDPATKQLVAGEFEDRVRQCLANVAAVLKEAGADLSHVVKTTVFLTDLDQFARMNAVYKQHFGEVRPARSCIQVCRLPMCADVEIEAIAVVP